MNPALVKKYRPYPTINLPNRTWPEKRIEKAPIWCSVDLRDGNQALVKPMSLEKKLEMFGLLTRLGFKEIEVGFPSASQVEYEFTRLLIEQDLIPEGMLIQVLTQAREPLIKKTFASLAGAREAIVHLYNSTSTLQRRTVFKMSRKEIVELAVHGANLLKEEQKKYPETVFRYEYSPESFTGTELNFALEVCEAVMNVLQPTPDNKIIINLPATVELSSPNIYADQIEWFCRNLSGRDAAIISIHAHNDRGCAVAATELALMAGGERVEGTLFGNGERTGNVDIITLALNMFTQGVDPELDITDINGLIEIYERVCRLPVHPRHPYAGELVYTAFSGSHQDAINKGMHEYEETESGIWAVPYLTIDPSDVGRTYESIIRINSQSGKGGVAYVLEKDFGFKLPKEMQPEFGKVVQGVTDREGRELLHSEIFQTFENEYLALDSPYELNTFHVVKRHMNKGEKRSQADVESTLLVHGREMMVSASGNGPLDAFCSALKKEVTGDFTLTSYHEHALTGGSSAKAAAYIEIQLPNGQVSWGTGVDTDIIIASIKAVLSSLNRLEKHAHDKRAEPAVVD
ncbi:2-isopropylmalate synthase [Desulfopila sp. IMCC35006]|uniref:2-isopropylmalate synthase n=1 Tax=Desulfopila sp. IMCC35006 TaxID=2569542 RepID=UPI0010AD3774|nr:2-isopropylmalate synthase [Desulfopila sp. IMCC35006]TKB28087.1 2-isopropylmalate synthase [Desulfopila sp. IMCC35006]